MAISFKLMGCFCLWFANFVVMVVMKASLSSNVFKLVIFRHLYCASIELMVVQEVSKTQNKMRVALAGLDFQLISGIVGFKYCCAESVIGRITVLKQCCYKCYHLPGLPINNQQNLQIRGPQVAFRWFRAITLKAQFQANRFCQLPIAINAPVRMIV